MYYRSSSKLIRALCGCSSVFIFFFSSRRRHTRCALVTGVQTCALPISMRMPAETRNYVPKLQAIKNIIAAPYLYGITLPAVENQPYFVAVPRLRDIDVDRKSVV